MHNRSWYDPNPADLESEEWDSYYSVSTGHRKSSSLPSDPSWKWGYPRVLPYDWEFRPGQTFRVDGQSFVVSGPHSGYTAFGQPVQYWRLVNKDKFLIWDGGGDWKQYVHAGDAELHYDVGPTRVLLYSDVLRTEYHKGDRTNNTIHYVVNLISASAFAAEGVSTKSYFPDGLPTGLPVLRGTSPVSPPEHNWLMVPDQLAPTITP